MADASVGANSGEDGSSPAHGPVTAAQMSSGRVYVGNLNFGTEWQSVKDFFRDGIGEGGRVEVLKYPNGRSKGCAVVEFDDINVAVNAINTLNGQMLQGRKLFLRPDRESKGFASEQPLPFRGRGGFFRGGRGGAPPAAYAYDSFRGRGRGAPFRGGRGRGRGAYANINKDGAVLSDDAALAAGTVPSVAATSPTAAVAAPASVASASSSSSSAAAAAAAASAPSSAAALDDSVPKPRSERPKADPGTQLYIGNLPWSMSWQELKDLCSQFGVVARADVMMDRYTGRSKGFGIVRFADAEAANAAQLALHEKPYKDRNLFVRADEYA